MTNRHVLDRLPFWIAGDLDAPESKSVQAHLDQCPGCQAAVEHLRASQAWLQEALAPPFDAADHAHLREAVLALVRQEAPPRRVPRLAPRPALLTAAAGVLLTLALLHPWRQSPPVVAVPAPPRQVVADTPALPETARPTPPRPAPLRLARARPIPRETADKDTAPTRIEFQTSDPTVRIIWLAQATPPSDPNPPLPEEP